MNVSGLYFLAVICAWMFAVQCDIHSTSDKMVKPTADIRISTNVIYTVNSNFLSVALSQSILNKTIDIRKHFKFRSKKLQAMAEALSPCYLRMGGNKADFLIFSLNETKPLKDVYVNEEMAQLQDTVLRFQSSQDDYQFEKKRNFTNYTMTASMWDEINHFMTKVGWDFLFDLNVFLRRDGSWDPDNAMLLLNYTLSKGYRLAGWELGNEPDDFHGYGFDITAIQFAKDFATMKNLLKAMPGYDRFQILGPSVTQLLHVRSQKYFTEFLKNGGGHIVTAPTFHHYYINGRYATVEDFLSPTVLDGLAPEIVTGNKIAGQYAPGRRVWLGETSSAWGGGAVGLSDRYVAGFMWLDKLGVAASQGIDVVVRQAFYGANYGLIDWYSLEPNPDYWLSVLYKKLVGSKVLLTESSDKTGHVRAYAHCSTNLFPAGSVTVYVLNLKKETVNVASSMFVDQHLQWYLLQPDEDILSQGVRLNGKLLHMEDDSLPDLMTPDIIKAPVLWPRQSFGFLVIPNAKVKVCM